MKSSRYAIVQLCAGTVLFTMLALTTGVLDAQQTTPKKKSPPVAIQAYGLGANLQNDGEFDQAVEEWNRFLTRFPDDPLAGKARHYLGVCLMQQKKPDYQKAADAFAAVIANHADFEQLEDAYLNLGACQFEVAQAGDATAYPKAAKAFTDLLAKYPKDSGGKYVDQASYFLAESLYWSGDKKGSLKPYTRVVNEFPKSALRPDALYGLGLAYEELKSNDKALLIFDLFLKGYPEHEFATEISMHKADVLYNTDKFVDAEKLFAEVAAVENFPDADYAVFQQARCVARQKKYAAAAALYASVSSLFPKSSYAGESVMAAGQCYYKAKEYDKAIPFLEKACAVDNPSSPEAAHWLCRIYLRNKQWQQGATLAAKWIPKAKADNPFQVELMLDEADALYALPDKKMEALKAYIKIATDHKDSSLAPRALYNAVFAAHEMKLYEPGISYAKSFLKKYPDHQLAADVKYLQAECNLLEKEYLQAEAIYAALVKNYLDREENASWRLRLGLAQFLQKKYADVVKTLKPSIESFTAAAAKAEALYLVGASQYHQGDFKGGAATLAASVAADATWRKADEAMLALARAQYKLGQFKEAGKTIETLLQQFPDTPLAGGAHFQAAQVALRLNQLDRSIAEYDKTLGLKSPLYTPHALYGKGWALQRQKKYPEAIVVFTSLIDGHPDHALVSETYDARANCRLQTKDYAGGVADENKYLESNPTGKARMSSLFIRALCEVGMKDHKGAVTTLETILTEAPKAENRDRVLYELAWAQKTLGQQEKALARFSELAETCPESEYAAECSYRIGEDEYAKKNYDAAGTAYAKAATLKPDKKLAEKILCKTGWVHYKKKDYKKAAEVFEEQQKKFPAGQRRLEAQFMSAECRFKLAEFEAALVAFEAALKDENLSPRIEEQLLLHAGQSAGQLEKWAEAEKYLSTMVTKFPKSTFLDEARFEKARALENLGQTDAAKKLYTTVADNSLDPVGARCRFMLGELLFGEKKYDDATREFKRVIYGYGGESVPADIKKWQAKSAYEAARCAEVRIRGAKGSRRTELIADATKYYTLVTKSHAESPEAPLAQKRLDALKKL